MVGLPRVKRGGGPKTVSGKVASSRNSIKTGAYSSHVTIPGESEDDFQQFFDEFVESLSPQGVFEQSMVHELAVIAWKKHRLDRLEQSGLSRIQLTPLTATDLKHEYKIDPQFDWLIADLSVVTEEFIQACRSNLSFIRGLSDQGISRDEFLHLPTTKPLLYKLVAEEALISFDLNKEQNLSPELLLSLRRTVRPGVKESFVSFAMRQIETRCEQALWVSDRLVEIESAIQAYKERRLLKLMQDVGLMRARDDLGRAFSRTLAEFRRQQQWRIKLAVDVSPVSE